MTIEKEAEQDKGIRIIGWGGVEGRCHYWLESQGKRYIKKVTFEET